MSALLDQALGYLETLVAFDTQNPPRNLDAHSELFSWLAGAVGPGFKVEVIDHGKGRVTFFAVRGEPDMLFNVHIDTVPALGGERFPPLELTIDDGRAYGRGACDIKGAAACLLAIAQSTEKPLAVLFTTDEEGGEGCCVAEFIASGRADCFRQVIVAEPTRCKAEFRHRGFLSARGYFSGIGGHSSEARALNESAVHRLARWSSEALNEAAQLQADGRRSCFNIGTVAGGLKSNIIADKADVFWSARLQPGEDNSGFYDHITSLPQGEFAEWVVSFSGPPLPTAGQEEGPSRAFAESAGLVTGDGLDFWTEASLFGAAGIPSLVLGPGNIEQAHARDEWVALEQLEQILEIYQGLVENND